MYRTGHYGVSLLAYAPVGLALVLAGRPAVAVAAGAGVLWLARLPDVDHRLPGVPHRGPTHSLAFAALVGAALGGAALVGSRALGFVNPTGLAALAAAVGVFGVCAHLLGDVLTPAGVRLFWPVGPEFSVSLTTADSTRWNYGLFALGLGATAAVALAAVRLG
ncbi:MAG: metal-dependent hydrolase [Haloferacaceae archaeon]